MCAFFAKDIFHLPRLRDVTYYLRLDTDSYIFEPLCYDPFERFHQRNLSYAYRRIGTDPDWVTGGMWSLVDSYASTHPEVEQNLERNGWTWPNDRGRNGSMEGNGFPIYYNNFELVRLDAFRRPDVTRWLNHLTSVPERIFKNRWGKPFSQRILIITATTAILKGDAPIRYATVNMFLDTK